jgi:hypothetical protein
MIVWATTFSLLTLFVPKLHAFFAPEKEILTIGGKASDLTGRYQPQRRNNTIGIYDENNPDHHQDPNSDNQDFVASPIDYDHMNNDTDLMSLNYIVNNSQHPLNDSKVRLNNLSRKGKLHGMLMEVHEVRKVSGLL